MESYTERHRRELQESGSVAALAHHDPSGLKALEEQAVVSETDEEPWWVPVDG